MNETKNFMEVHHHPHIESPPAGQAGKRLKHYLFEFFMLFLAVFCGFLAENIREKIVLREKGKVYIKGIIHDLKDDTARITYTVPKQNELVTKMDSALSIPVTQLHNLEKQDTFFYHFIFFYDWIMLFLQNDNTVVQLCNAGGFSVIHNQKAIDSITGLYRFYDGVKANGDFYIEIYKNVQGLSPKFIRIAFYPTDPKDPVFYKIHHQTEFFTKYDTSLIEELYSWIRMERGQLELYKENVLQYKEAATRLIQFLQKEYHLV